MSEDQARPPAGGEDTSSSEDSQEPYIDSPSSTPPLPIPAEIDFQHRHIALERFGERLQTAAKTLFPNKPGTRYSKVTVLILCWDEEDPKLPVSLEITRLWKLFEDSYHFDMEIWRIPTDHSHFELNQKISSFVRPADDDKNHLKIVYYSGHARLAENRTLVWVGWSRNREKPPPTLIWSGIQALLEQAYNDVLILLDCCCSGTTNTGEGNGVTELIAACGYNNEALGVGPYSFTNALIIALEKLLTKPSFPIGELYSHIFRNIQHRALLDGTERHTAPIHLSLTQEARFPRSIQLSACQPLEPARILAADSLELSPHPGHGVPRGPVLSTESGLGNTNYFSPQSRSGSKDRLPELSTNSQESRFPRLAFAVRLKESFRPGELSEDLFKEWFRTIPAFVEEVKVEAGFDSFSSLLIISVPVAMLIYMPRDPAVFCLGPITSSNQLLVPTPTGHIERTKDLPSHSDQQAKAMMDIMEILRLKTLLKDQDVSEYSAQQNVIGSQLGPASLRSLYDASSSNSIENSGDDSKLKKSDSGGLVYIISIKNDLGGIMIEAASFDTASEMNWIPMRLVGTGELPLRPILPEQVFTFNTVNGSIRVNFFVELDICLDHTGQGEFIRVTCFVHESFMGPNLVLGWKFIDEHGVLERLGTGARVSRDLMMRRRNEERHIPNQRKRTSPPIAGPEDEQKEKAGGYESPAIPWPW